MSSSRENLGLQEIEDFLLEIRTQQKRKDKEPDEPLDEKEVYLSIYTGVCVNDTNEIQQNDRESQEWTLQMNHTQEWFMRCSWMNKFLFVEALCKATTGCLVIETVLKCTESIISKDVVESLTGNLTEFAYDRIPRDDDRCLPHEDLKKAMEKDFLWFVRLKPTRQISVILRLLRLGGGGLVFTLHKSMLAVYTERQIEFGRLSIAAAAEDAMRAMASTLSRILGQSDSRQKVVDNVKKSASKASTWNTENGKRTTPSEFTSKKLEQLARREMEFTEYKKAKGLATEMETLKTSKKLDTKESIDYLQILPIYLNRRIMSHVDEKTLSNFKKVGKYWGKMIDESINEKSGRRAINAKINKIIGMKPEKRREKCQEEETRGEEGKKNGKSKENDDDELIEADESARKNFFKRNNLSEVNMINSTRIYEGIFAKKFKIMKLDKSAFKDRCCCWDNKVTVMASSTASNVVYFYSMRTGARLNYSVFGIKSPITCIALHEDGHHVIVGCKDGSLISVIARTNRKDTVFNGHIAPIRYYQLWSGICLLCIDLSGEYTVSSILLSINLASPRSIIGTEEGIVVLVDLVKKAYTGKVKVHHDKITALHQNGNVLITASKRGKIRVWDLTQLETNLTAFNPYYDIHVAGCVSSLFLHRDQMIVGSNNGTIKIISFANGKTIKVLKAAGQTPVLGLAVTEDRFTLKVIVWHGEGIEMRIFSLVKFPFPSPLNGKSIKKNNRKCKQKGPPQHEAKKIKFSQLFATESTLGVGSGDDFAGEDAIQITPNICQ